MRYIFILVLIWVPFWLGAQSDSMTAMETRVDSLLNITKQLQARQELDSALAICRMAGDISRDSLGKESVSHARCVFTQGILCFQKRNFQDAETYLQDAKDIQAKVLGTDNEEYLKSLNNLGIVYWSQGRYEDVETCFLELKNIRKRKYGAQHPAYASALNNLGIAYYGLAMYEKAEVEYKESLQILADVVGKEDPEYVKSLNNLAEVYRAEGKFSEAEKGNLEALEIRRRTVGPEDPQYAISANNLGALYFYLANFDASERYYLEAKSIWEKDPDRYLSEYAKILFNLGSIGYKTGKNSQAKQYYQEALQAMEKAHEENQMSYAETLTNLALVYLGEKAYEDAEALLLKAKTLQQGKPGGETSALANTLNALAEVALASGQSDQAESLYLESLAICEKILGRESTYFYKVFGSLALFYRQLGSYDQAEPYLFQVRDVEHAILDQASTFLSEKELDAYFRSFSQSQDELITYTLLSGSESGARACYDSGLYTKGYLLQSVMQTRKLALANPESTEKYLRLKGYTRRLADQYALHETQRNPELVADLEAKSNVLEKELVQMVAGFGESQRQVSWTDVQAKLRPSEAAIEFLRYKVVCVPDCGDSIAYAAVILRPGMESPKVVPLFQEPELSALVGSHGEERKAFINELYTLSSRGLVADGPTLRSLYALIWAPMNPVLDGVHTIYYSPAGLLHTLNLAAIPVDPFTTVADHFQLVRLNSTRQMVISPPPAEFSPGVILYGDITYDLDSLAEMAFASQMIPEQLAMRGDVSFPAENRGGPNESWTLLPYTRLEVDSIARIFDKHGYPADIREKLAATEESFKDLSIGSGSPYCIHLATHGFFFSDPRDSQGPGQRQDDSAFKSSNHPLIRSGLIMAAGNRAWNQGTPVVGREDGILTAYEISQMDISGTALVVLSACETGLGDIQGNEGVYGLQRAFKIAGAKYLIMSLWQVPDRQTMLFMSTFYHHWLNDVPAATGQALEERIPKAFHDTQKEMREKGFDPYQWAGFVLVE